MKDARRARLQFPSPRRVRQLRRRRWQFWIVATTLTALVTSAVAGLLITRHRSEQKEQIRDLIAIRLGTMGQLALEQTETAVTTAESLARNLDLLEFLSTGDDRARGALERHFIEVLTATGLFDQIRFIGLDGREVARVEYRDGNPVALADRQLQDKRERDYFQQGLELEAGEILSTRMDLNRENGEIELPLKPTERFITPVFDSGGNRRGMLVINYLGDRELDLLDRFPLTPYGINLAVDNEGWYLRGPTSAYEWGFILPGREDKNLAIIQPDLWEAMEREHSGYFENAGGIYVFRSLLRDRPGVEPHRHLLHFIEMPAFLASLEARELQIVHGATLLLLILGSAYWIEGERRLEKELEEDHLKLLAETFDSRIGILIADENAVILTANKAFSQVTGYSMEAIVGQRLDFLESDVHEAIFYEGIWSSLREQDEWSGELWCRCQDGHSRPFHLSLTAIQDSRGQTIHHVAQFLDIAEQKRHEEQLLQQAARDSLTGCYNRRMFDSFVRQMIDESRRYRRPFCFVLMDIDHFKRVNDSHGHDVGDRVLTQLARLMRQNIRASDLMSRWGGEEFAILLRGASLRGAYSRAEMLRRVIADSDIAPPITASFGVAEWQADEDHESLIKRADEMLYRAKQTGRNRVVAAPT